MRFVVGKRERVAPHRSVIGVSRFYTVLANRARNRKNAIRAMCRMHRGHRCPADGTYLHDDRIQESYVLHQFFCFCLQAASQR